MSKIRPWSPGTVRPLIDGDLATWWNHTHADIEEPGDFMVLAPDGTRWKVLTVEPAPEHDELYGPTLRLVTAQRER